MTQQQHHTISLGTANDTSDHFLSNNLIACLKEVIQFLVSNCNSLTSDGRMPSLHVETDAVSKASEMCSACHGFTSFGADPASSRKFKTLQEVCLPNLDPYPLNCPKHNVFGQLVDGAIASGAVIRIINTSPIAATTILILDVAMLAVRPSLQGRKYGTRLVQHLKALLLMLMANVPGSFGCVHVQADSNAVDFWLCQGFESCAIAEELTEALARYDPMSYKLFDPTTSMIAFVKRPPPERGP